MVVRRARNSSGVVEVMNLLRDRPVNIIAIQAHKRSQLRLVLQPRMCRSSMICQLHGRHAFRIMVEIR
jgi:hypothetical protein